ncbi:hypothetical protein NOCARDAX2BIS_600049 [Nocardioides sp. AX2bis]|nr:hypothetical protein NOCARDAX2BIS_600049 [Nocardioides sp. AX2bis]
MKTRITSSRNSLGNAFGMVHILPASTHIDADQMSPIRAADPICDLTCENGLACTHGQQLETTHYRPGGQGVAGSNPVSPGLPDHEMVIRQASSQAFGARTGATMAGRRTGLVHNEVTRRTHPAQSRR